MKVLKYNLCTRVNHGTEETPKWKDILTPVTMDWNEVNEKIAKQEAYNCEYVIDDDGNVEPIIEPTHFLRHHSIQNFVHCIRMQHYQELRLKS